MNAFISHEVAAKECEIKRCQSGAGYMGHVPYILPSRVFQIWACFHRQTRTQEELRADYAPCNQQKRQQHTEMM